MTANAVFSHKQLRSLYVDVDRRKEKKKKKERERETR